jgi:nucleotide-binding universal stress UspA family protein
MNAAAEVISRLESQPWQYEQPLARGIVAAVDDSSESIEGLKMASAIALTTGWALHVVNVVRSLPANDMMPSLNGELSPADMERLELRRAVVKILLDASCPDGGYSYGVILGRPASSIISAAECRGAHLIVAGRTPHNPVERLIGAETTLQMMRLSDVPVLAVSRASDNLNRVVVATDFSESSVKAACLAAELMGTSGTMHLVYVDEPQDVVAGDSLRYERHSPSDIVAWFRRTSAALIQSSSLRIEPTVLTGRPEQVLLDFSERVGAGMIAAGSHGYSRMKRLLLGSVSTGLVRNAQCPVLVVRSVL